MSFLKSAVLAVGMMSLVACGGGDKSGDTTPAAQPCGDEQPCGDDMDDPCAADPCAEGDPCAADPCAADPCAEGNPCEAAEGGE